MTGSQIWQSATKTDAKDTNAKASSDAKIAALCKRIRMGDINIQ